MTMTDTASVTCPCCNAPAERVDMGRPYRYIEPVDSRRPPASPIAGVVDECERAVMIVARACAHDEDNAEETVRRVVKAEFAKLRAALSPQAPAGTDAAERDGIDDFNKVISQQNEQIQQSTQLVDDLTVAISTAHELLFTVRVNDSEDSQKIVRARLVLRDAIFPSEDK